MRQSQVRKLIGLLSLILFVPLVAYGVGKFDAAVYTDWVKVGGTAAADADAAIEINSTTKGLLISRMTEVQRDAIVTPPTGLMVFNTDDNQFNYYDGDSWEGIGGGIAPLSPDEVVITDGSGVLTASGVAASDLQNALMLNGVPVSGIPPNDTEILTFNNGTGDWEPATAPVGIGLPVSSTDNALVLWDGTGGDTIKNQTNFTISGGDMYAGNNGQFFSTDNHGYYFIPGDGNWGIGSNICTYSTTNISADRVCTNFENTANHGWAVGSTAGAVLELRQDLQAFFSGAVNFAGNLIAATTSYLDGVWYLPNGPPNFIGNWNGLRNTTGWNLYADAAAATPVDGTGGSPTSTFARNVGASVRGGTYFTFTKPASNEQGEGVSYDFTIDGGLSDSANQINVSFPYFTSTMTSGDVLLFVYDATGGVRPLQCADGTNTLYASSVNTKATCRFYATPSVSDYRLIFHIATTSATGWLVNFGAVKATEEQTVPGAIITQWAPVTVTGSWIANTTYTVWMRRVGDQAEFEGKIATTGAPTSANLTVNLPSGMVVDTTKIDANTTHNLGWSRVLDSGTANFFGFVEYNNTTSVAMYIEVSSSTNGTTNAVSQTVPMTWANGDYMQFHFSVPIASWQASAALSTNETLFQNPAKSPTTATSTTKTAGATNHYHQYATNSNSLTLTAGVWELTGVCKFGNNGSTAYTIANCGWWGANGADSSSQPGTTLAGVSGLTVLSAVDSARAELSYAASGDNAWVPAPKVKVRCASSCVVYLNTLAALTTAANSRITVYANAERAADFSAFTPYASDRWYINAQLSGSGVNASLGIANVASYTEMTDAGLTLQPISGSSPVGVMCSSTNAATAPSTGNTTCAAGSESVGINFYIPEPGVYEVCFNGSWAGVVDSTEQLSPTFQLIETPTNAQTLTLQSGMTVAVTCLSASTDFQCAHNIGHCGLFDWRSSPAGAVKGVRLMYEQLIAGTPDSSVVVADENASVGQRKLGFRVRKY